MGILSRLDKTKQQPTTEIVNNTSEPPTGSQEVVLTDQEVDFILHKLRESTYKGYEFEKYATVYSKLSSQILKK
jgi:hypothetical protein